MKSTHKARSASRRHRYLCVPQWPVLKVYSGSNWPTPLDNPAKNFLFRRQRYKILACRKGPSGSGVRWQAWRTFSAACTDRAPALIPHKLGPFPYSESLQIRRILCKDLVGFRIETDLVLLRQKRLSFHKSLARGDSRAVRSDRVGPCGTLNPIRI